MFMGLLCNSNSRWCRLVGITSIVIVILLIQSRVDAVPAYVEWPLDRTQPPVLRLLPQGNASEAAGRHLNGAAGIEQQVDTTTTTATTTTMMYHSVDAEIVSKPKSFGRHRPTRPPPIDSSSSSKMFDVVGRRLGVPQEIPLQATEDSRDVILQVADESHWYMTETVWAQEFYQPVGALCRNHHARCTEWAAKGECERNEHFMGTQCAPTCQTCQILHTATHCPVDQNERNALYPGDLDRLFEGMLQRNDEAKINNDSSKSHLRHDRRHYNITTWSRPTPAPGDEGRPPTQLPYISDGPWIITIDDFLSAAEAETLIQLGAEEGYHRSTDTGAIQEDGSRAEALSEERTSTNAWCYDHCDQHTVTRAVVQRIHDDLFHEYRNAISMDHAEYWQLLHYEPGQFYGVHHDYIVGQERSAAGSRILTVFLYLNDVAGGGATNFPELDNLAVHPKRGRVLIWPSVLNEDPHTLDWRTHHEAQVVTAGVKYGANAWYHIRNYRAPSLKGC